MRTALRRQFPDHQGKYREFLRFWPLRTGPRPGKAFVYLINLSKFPTQRNRELFGANRELFSRIRELVVNNREAAFGASRSHQCVASIIWIFRGLKILWSESSVRVRPPPPAPANFLISIRLIDGSRNLALVLNYTYDIGDIGKFSSVVHV
jgi:hypothetical protein